MKFKIKEFETKLSPFDIYSIFSGEKDSIFLDSSKEDENLSKYYYGKTLSKWANKQYLKDENVTVYVYEVNDLDHPIAQYHA